MNLWIVFMFILSSMQSFASDRSKIKFELDALLKLFEESENWKNNYQRDLRLYTAKIDDYTDTCTGPVFDCFYKEIDVVLEELHMAGEEAIAKKMLHTIDHMKMIVPAESDMTDGCKKCEEYEEKSFEDFIKGFQLLAQKMNTPQ